MGPLVITLVVAWFIYVPIHELLHVLGCVMAGGEVSRLEIAPRYGGALLARVFPFVVSGGEYAGRLSDFDWKGSDLIYLATDFMPYVLTVLIGVPLIRAATRRRRPIVFGLGVILGLAPFYSLPGDYYEMGSIITTRVVTWTIGPEKIEGSKDGSLKDETLEPSNHQTFKPAFNGLRSDDVFKLLADVVARPRELGLESAGAVAAGLLIILVGVALALVLALLTYWLGCQVSVISYRL